MRQVFPLVLALGVLVSSISGCSDPAEPVQPPVQPPVEPPVQPPVEPPAPPMAPPPTSFAGAQIAFLRQWGGNTQIVVARADGTGAVPITSYGGCQVGSPDGPRLSPDGTKLMFMTDVMGPADICVLAGDGSGARGLGIWAFTMWSPDGSQILYVNQAGLSAVNADGSDARLLLPRESLPQWVSYPDVSSGGTIVFEGGWLMEMDGSGMRRIGGPGTPMYDPDWSPDATRIAYVGGHDRRTIESVAADGSDPRIHYRAPEVGEMLGDPDWSPDGSAIAFTRYQGVSGGGIYIVDVATGAASLLVPGGWAASWVAGTP
jgi:Tol biopolymer transport system component